MQLDTNQKVTIFGLIVAILVGTGYYLCKNLLTPVPPQTLLTPKSTAIFIHICGAVKNEGVYKVTADDHICDVIKMAGGGLPNADFSSLNLAEKVKDSQKIAIPFKAMLLPETRAAGALPQAAKKQKRINLNMASLAELDELPGVGPATAKKIIAARPFAKAEDVAKIPRFGKKKYEKIKDKIYI